MEYKNKGSPLYGKGGSLHIIPTAIRATEHQDVVTMEGASLTDGEAEAHHRNKLEQIHPINRVEIIVPYLPRDLEKKKLGGLFKSLG